MGILGLSARCITQCDFVMSNFNLSDDDVVNMDRTNSFVDASTFTGRQVKIRIAEAKTFLGGDMEAWAGEGVKCEVLRPGEGWRKGKVRLRMEFVPDEPDEPSPGLSDAVRSLSPNSEQ